MPDIDERDCQHGAADTHQHTIEALCQMVQHWQSKYERERDLYDRQSNELVAADERIRGLEADNKNLIATLRSESTALVAEREVSDKLEKALNELYDLEKYRKECGGETIGYRKDSPRVHAFARAALVEVAAIRATHTNREQADTPTTTTKEQT